MCGAKHLPLHTPAILPEAFSCPGYSRTRESIALFRNDADQADQQIDKINVDHIRRPDRTGLRLRVILRHGPVESDVAEENAHEDKVKDSRGKIQAPHDKLTDKPDQKACEQHAADREEEFRVASQFVHRLG